MVEIKDKSQQQAEKNALLMSQADKYFPRIDPGTSNGQLLMRAINLQGASSLIVHRLEEIERTGELFNSDQELNTWLDTQIQSKVIHAPMDPVDKYRWLALMCIAASIKEDFSYGNVIIVPDYLPENSAEFREYERMYGAEVIDDILSKRESLRK